MKTHELKRWIEKYRAGLKERAGAGVTFSESGPVGMSVVDAIFSVLEEQENRLSLLEKRLAEKK
jgi:hypothetical protein